MKIITIFAMGCNGEIAANSTDNFGLPWPKNQEDMDFVNYKLKEYSGEKSAIMMTSATWKSLPTKLQIKLDTTYNQVILLGRDGGLEFYYPKEEDFAQRFKQGLGLVLRSNIDTLVYFGSPKFLRQMISISDITYVTIIDNPVTENELCPEYKVTFLPLHTQIMVNKGYPRVKIKDITNGTIYKVASKQYETV